MTKIEIRWVKPLGDIKPYIFEISTPAGWGTGFQIYCSRTKGFCALATAYHVIQHAYEWDEPIRLTYMQNMKSLLLKSGDDNRTIFVYPNRDLALILFDGGDLETPTSNPKITPPTAHANDGVEIGWCGFPSNVPRRNLCFFEGVISSYLVDEETYLIDGVSINGVSGGPAFTVDSENGETTIIGVINAYYPNLSTGVSMPGLCSAIAIEPYRKKLSEYQSLDEADEQAKLQNPIEESKQMIIKP